MTQPITPPTGYLMCQPWLAYRVIAGTTCRQRHNAPFNLSYSYAESRTIYYQNLRTWLDDFALTPLYERNRVFFLQLTHGTRIVAVDETVVQQHASDTFVPDCDGLVTHLQGADRVVLTVKTADCVPVFLFDPHTRASAMLHCGWRGAAQQLVTQGIEALCRASGSRAPDLLLALGPCIRQARYAVGPEVAQLFPYSATLQDGYYVLDLAQEVRRQAEIAGLQPENCSDCGYCTYDAADLFYSYRRDGPGGSMLSFITVL